MAQIPDYSIDVQTPFASALQGYQVGGAIRAQQQQQTAAQTQQQLLVDLANKPNATADDYSRVMTAIPSLAEPLTKAWTAKNTAQQQAHASDLLQVGAAIKSGQPEVAADYLTKKADAMEAGGAPPQEVQALRAHIGVIKAHPEFALGQIQAMLAVNPLGKEAAGALATFGAESRAQQQAPAELAIKQAQASKGTTEAGIAAATAPESIAKAGLENVNLAQDAESKAAQRNIAALNVQIAQANSETERGRLTLERDKLTNELALKTRERATDAQNHLDEINRSLGTVDRLMKHPGLTGGVLGGTGTMSGNLLAHIPGSEDADFRLQLETLKSQEFMNGIAHMKGTGALSNEEGRRVEQLVASLDPNQSVKQFKEQLGIIQTTLKRGQAKVVAGGYLPTAGGAYVMSHPTLGKVTDGDINRLLLQYPGATRQQVLDYLNSTKAQ